MAQSKKPATDEGRKYQKKDLLLADRLKPYRDVAEAVLDQERTYTLREAEVEIEKFLKGKVR